MIQLEAIWREVPALILIAVVISLRASTVYAEAAERIELVSPVSGGTINTPLTATLEWKDHRDEGSYLVVIAADKELKEPVIHARKVKERRLRVALCPETDYWWQVTAAGEKAKGGPWCFRTPKPEIREDASAMERFGPARPGSRFALAHEPYIMEPLPEDPNVPLSPWFYKKAYDMAPPPKLAAIRDRLPAPILDGEHSKALLDTYWYCWQVAFETWLYVPEATGLAVSNFCGCPDWSGWGGGVDYDMAVIMQYARYSGAAYPYISILDNYYCRMHENGLIHKEGDNGNREVWSSAPTMVSVFAWTEWENYLVTGDRDRLRKVLLPLVKYYEWTQRYQRRADGSYYSDQIVHGDWGVAANAWQAMSAKSLSRIAEVAGRPDLRAYFEHEYDTIAALVNGRLWDEKNGLYGSLFKNGRLSTEPEPGKLHKYALFFTPLMAGFAPPDRAERAIKQLLDPALFLGKNGILSLSLDSSLYVMDREYCVPADDPKFRFRHEVWSPTMLVALKALQNYAHHDAAIIPAERYARGFAETYKRTGDVSEFLWVDKFEAGGHPQFVGWSGYGPICGLIEFILGFEVEAPQKKLTWRIRRLERHGIERLWFGGITASLVCEARSSAEDPCRITVDSDGDFDLVVDWGAGAKTYKIEPGYTTLTTGG